MGIFSRKPKPAFTAPDLPMSEAPVHRRVSLMNLGMNSSLATLDPSSQYQGQQQTTFLGRRVSSNVIPAFARKASLAHAEQDRVPAHLRMGESDNYGTTEFGDVFRAQLTLDAPSDDEDQPSWLDKGKGRATGWAVAPPRGPRRKRESKEGKERKRNKRLTRGLDDDLDTFNLYAANGLTPLIPTPAIPGGLPAFLEDEAEFVKAETRVVPVGDGFDALDVMADHIFRIGVQKKKWFKAPRVGKRDDVATGVTLRARTGLYRTFPVKYEALEEFETAICKLNPEVAIKIKSTVVSNVIATYM
jgi:hypothetical protein